MALDNSKNNVLKLVQSEANYSATDQNPQSGNAASDIYSAIIDILPDHVAVIDTRGNIQHVNAKWEHFAENNGYQHQNGWEGINYLDICKQSADRGDPYAQEAVTGIQKVINGDVTEFQLEYPCHSPVEQRWFLMRVTQFGRNKKNILISHQNISKIALQAKTDSLLNIANRRHFEEFYDQEWKRCTRSQEYLAMAFIDLDYFKVINDTYGHEVGDYCLMKVSDVLSKYAKRVSDLCARYGGDEMVIIWGSTNIDRALYLSKRILEEINEIKIDMAPISQKKTLGASIGVSSIIPQKGMDKKAFTQLVDEYLYQAKHAGRNTVYSGQ